MDPVQQNPQLLSELSATIRDTLIIVAAGAALYVAAMLYLRPWRTADRDDRAPMWRFLVLGFGFRLRRNRGLAAASWAVLIACVVAAAVYHRMASDRLLAELGISEATPMLESDAPVVEIPIQEVTDGYRCEAVQTAGANPTRCTMLAADGMMTLRIDGFDLTCEVSCVSVAGADAAGPELRSQWRYSRGPEPGGPSADGDG